MNFTQNMDCLENYEILLGTYEAFVLGYKLTEGKKPKLQTSIADHAHAGSIRCIAAADKFLITSGLDEIVKIFNLRNRTKPQHTEYDARNLPPRKRSIVQVSSAFTHVVAGNTICLV